MEGLLHLHKNRLNHDLHVFLLFIPAIVFALMVVLLFSGFEKNNQQTLGTSTEQLP
jgi:hypothetical protein